MNERCSDYVLHPPGGSSLPGNPPANPYINYPPKQLREIILTEGNEEEKAKMISALKQWERQYTYPGYPWRDPRARGVAARFIKLSEQANPAINLPYYQDLEVPQGEDEIIDSLRGLYDNDNAERPDYNRQGIRPIRDIDIAEGDFLTPTEPPMGQSVKERGDGPDPDGMEYPDPPTGGDIDAY